MRTREEVIDSADIRSTGKTANRVQVQALLAIVEMLVDIRDILQEANKVEIIGVPSKPLQGDN